MPENATSGETPRMEGFSCLGHVRGLLDRHDWGCENPCGTPGRAWGGLGCPEDEKLEGGRSKEQGDDLIEL